MNNHGRLVVLAAEVAVAGAEACHVDRRERRREREEGSNSFEEQHDKIVRILQLYGSSSACSSVCGDERKWAAPKSSLSRDVNTPSPVVADGGSWVRFALRASFSRADVLPCRGWLWLWRCAVICSRHDRRAEGPKMTVPEGRQRIVLTEQSVQIRPQNDQANGLLIAKWPQQQYFAVPRILRAVGTVYRPAIS